MRLTVRQTLRNPVHSLGLEDVVLVRHHRLPAVLVHPATKKHLNANPSDPLHSLLRGDFLAVGEPCRRRRPLDVGCAAARPVRERAVDGAERGEPPVARVEEVVHEVAAEAHPERAEQSRAEGVLRVRVAVPPPVPVPVLVKICAQRLLTHGSATPPLNSPPNKSASVDPPKNSLNTSSGSLNVKKPKPPKSKSSSCLVRLRPPPLMRPSLPYWSYIRRFLSAKRYGQWRVQTWGQKANRRVLRVVVGLS
jgi:hypothetical protein